jgi:hypothetical protein
MNFLVKEPLEEVGGAFIDIDYALFGKNVWGE